MRVVRFIIAAAASSAAVAQQSPPPAPAAQPPITVTGQAVPDEDKPVCKFVETGSLIAKKVCMPKSEWARAEHNTDDEMRSMRDWQRVRCNMGTTC
jgi:hypothetical protein